MESSRHLVSHGIYRLLVLGVAFAAVPPIGSGLYAQDSEAALGGVVLDDLSMEPIESATVSIVGADMTTVTDEDGAFVLADPPLGRISIRVVAADRVSLVQEVEVHAESITHVQFFLLPIDAVVSELLVRDPSGPEPMVRTPTTAVDILARQLPGTLGALPLPGDTDQPIMLRGLGTFGDNFEPILLVDGVRVSAAGVYDALSQIPADDVETIEVLRGAAGAFLHPDGANGVIRVRTKLGPVPGLN